MSGLERAGLTRRSRLCYIALLFTSRDRKHRCKLWLLSFDKGLINNVGVRKEKVLTGVLVKYIRQDAFKDPKKHYYFRKTTYNCYFANFALTKRDPAYVE